MFRNQITPLRSDVGPAIQVSAVSIADCHPEVLTAAIKDISVLGTYLAAENKDYSAFLPASIAPPSSQDTFLPATGVSTFVTPVRDKRDFSFDAASRSVFVAVLLQPGKNVKPRDLFVELNVTVDANALLGGICYYGYPFLPYFLNEQGESSANYGLPRKITIICDNPTSGFIDNENILTLEEPISHSGVHFLSIEPIKTGQFTIRFSDWPAMLTNVTHDKEGRTQLQTSYGLLVPSIIPYEYLERTNYDPKVPYGVLACAKPGLTDGAYFHYTAEPAFTTGAGREKATKSGFSADYLYLLDRPAKQFMNFSAASITGQKRRFSGGKGFNVLEEFISTPLKKDESIDLYLEQSEENNRCVSGFELDIDRSNVPSGTVSSQLIEVRVYEIDLPDGVSPVSITDDPEKHKYFTLIYSGSINSSKASDFTCKFLRPSLSRYFLYRLKNKVDGLCQIKISALELVQSAHVSVTSRSSRVQRVESVSFRLIGERLADDYAKLGDDDFSVTVETVNAGTQKKAIFAARNLLALLNSGNAHIYSNYRRQEVVEETSKETLTTHAGSKDIHSTTVNSLGWRRNETGSGVEALWNTTIADAGNPLALTREEQSRGSLLKGDFDSSGTSETRTHNEQVGLEALDEEKFQFLTLFLNLLYGDNVQSWLPQNRVQTPTLLRNDDSGYNWENGIWRKGFPTSNLYAGLINNVSVPPCVLELTSIASEIVNVGKWVQKILDTKSLTVPDKIVADHVFNNITRGRGILNGLSIGGNFGASFYVGGGISLSSQPVFPSQVYTASSGTSGNIAKQANRTAYNYAQVLNMMFDKARAITVFEESVMKRTAARSIETVKQRQRGWEVMWNNRYVDIVTCKIPLGITLPASARNYYDNVDQSIRVRFGGNLIDSGVEADVWFDISEDTIKEDY